MRGVTATLALVLAAELIAAPAEGAAGFAGLGDLPGGATLSQALGVSADGSVVVGESESASGTEAFRWTAAGGMQGLGDVPGGPFGSSAAAASADGGVIVGAAAGPVTSEAFVWTEAGGMVLLDPTADIFSGIPISAYDVSADGSKIVGPLFGLATCLIDGYVWTQATGLAEDCTNAGGMLVESVDYHAVSGDASTVAGFIHLFGTDFGAHSNWSIVGLGTAFGANPDGSVVVGGGDGTAFRWSDPGPFPEYLGDLPGGLSRSQAWDVSGDGSVVIGSSDVGAGCFQPPEHSPASDPNTAGCEAFLWDSAAGMRALKDELENVHGLDLTGWTLREARGISDDGNVIVGWGVDPGGDTEGWIAVLETACSNGIDDDGDGNTDLADFGCDDAADLSERTPAVACDDGADNDADGLTDFPADPGCQSAFWNVEDPQCADGIDNDLDSFIDWDGGAQFNGGVPLTPVDPQCTGKPWRLKERRTGCGLGAEPALLLLPLAFVRRRLRRRRS